MSGLNKQSISAQELAAAAGMQRRLHGGDNVQANQVLAAQNAFSDMKKRYTPLSDDHLDLLFRESRTQYAWQDKGVSEDLLRALYDLTKMASTSVNSCPGRFIFLRSEESKERLRPTLTGNNVEKIMGAPVVVIIAHDNAFYERLDQLAPYADLKPMFVDKPAYCEATAFRNGTLQGAQLMMAARALGLDCGPMSGFNNQLVDDEFFAGTTVVSNFLCCLGYGDPSRIFQRLPRLEFNEACEFL
jgi:3-hydroxypropanoate dehydrogenase